MPDKVVVRLITRKPADEGDIPEPVETYIYHWHRILGALVVLVVLVGGVIAGLRHFIATQEPAVRAGMERAPLAESTAAPSPLLQRTPDELSSQPSALPSPDSGTQVGLAVASERAKGAAPPPSFTGTAKVSIRSPNIKRAQLTSNVVNGQPVDQIGPIIAMNQQGMVKVFLWTEIDDLKGRKLFHDWYWGGERRFHARIPVTRNHQTGTSIKFIERSMTGPWEVKVIDNYKRVYAEARFEVR